MTQLIIIYWFCRWNIFAYEKIYSAYFEKFWCKTNLMKRKQSRSFSSALFYYSKVKHNVVKTTSNANSIFKWNHVTTRRVNANMQNPMQYKEFFFYFQLISISTILNFAVKLQNYFVVEMRNIQLKLFRLNILNLSDIISSPRLFNIKCINKKYRIM